MSSQKRKDASRKNGARGGPKSPKGKARSSENAIKHNLYAKHCQTLSTESEELFVDPRLRLLRDYDPQTTIECETVEQLAMAAWRVRRYGTTQAWFLEMEMANQAEWIVSTEGEDCEFSLRAAHAIKACLEKSSGFKDLARFESRLLRTYERLVRLLHDIQRDRLQQSGASTTPEPITPQNEENEPRRAVNPTLLAPETACSNPENDPTTPWKPRLTLTKPEMPRIGAEASETPPSNIALVA